MSIIPPNKIPTQSQLVPWQPQYGSTGSPLSSQVRTANAPTGAAGGSFSLNGGISFGGGAPAAPQPQTRGSGSAGDAPTRYTGPGWQEQQMKDQSTKLQQNRQYAHDEAMARLQAQLAADAQAQKMEMLKNFSINGSFSGFGEAPGGQAPPIKIQMPIYQQMGGGGAMPQIQMPDMGAAQAAAFARAKDQVGRTGASALAGLRSAMGARGMLGSGNEFRGLGNIAQAGLGELGNVSREQAIQEAQARSQAALTGYQGAITMRGQDQQNLQAQNQLAQNLALGQYQGAITQRGQDMEMARMKQQQNMQILSGLLGAIF